MLSTIVWTLVFLGLVALFGWQVWRRVRILFKVRPAPERFERIPERIKEMLVGAIAQAKFFTPGQDQPAGIIHAFVFWGFLILGLQIGTMFTRGWLPDAYLPCSDRTRSAPLTCSCAMSWRRSCSCAPSRCSCGG
jgi:hypothetical protein